MAIVFRKSRRKRKVKHGFRIRIMRPGGRRAILRRRRKGRERLAVP